MKVIVQTGSQCFSQETLTPGRLLLPQRLKTAAYQSPEIPHQRKRTAF